MKILRFLSLCFAILAVAPAYSQGQDSKQPKEAPATPSLTKFDLDFPGGRPDELVAAIQKSLGRPLNAIVPTQDSVLRIPPLRMKGVDAAQLFMAILFASHERVYEPNGSYVDKSYGFRTQGTPSDDSVWYFYTEGPAVNSPTTLKECRYYLLTPYLDQGLTVDDITTAVQTGWKMQGASDAVALSYHKETKLLIAVGDREHLRVIDAALATLGAPKAKPAGVSAIPGKSPEEQKPEK
jgi:hypothetical protein